jgi:hypothetical protein
MIISYRSINERLAFIPSKTFGQYWKHELIGSRDKGPYGLISGADHPVPGA